MRKRKKLTKNQELFRKQVKRIKRAYKRLSVEGYRLDNPLESIVQLEMPKRVTKKTLEKLKKVTPAFLRENSTALDKSGKIQSGTVVYNERRTIKRLNKKLQKQRQIQFNQGDIIYENIMDMIDKFPTKGSSYLSSILSYEISRYGKDNVLRAISQIPQEFIKSIQEVMYYEKDRNSNHKALKDFAEILKGSVLTVDESKEISAILDELDIFEE